MQDDGGTANGGVDLDPTPNTITVNVTSVNDAPAGTDKTVTTLEDTAYTFAAADFGFSDPNDSPANSLSAVEDHHAAGGRHAEATTASAVDGRAVRHGGRHHRRQADVHAGGQRQRQPAMPASPSRCRTTAARPTAA